MRKYNKVKIVVGLWNERTASLVDPESVLEFENRLDELMPGYSIAYIDGSWQGKREPAVCYEHIDFDESLDLTVLENELRVACILLEQSAIVFEVTTVLASLVSHTKVSDAVRERLV